MTDSPGQRCVAEWRQNVAFAIACAAYNQPLMGMDWAKPQNRRWLEAADRLLEQLAPDIDALVRRERADVLVDVEALCVDYLWRNRKEHGYVDAEPCGYCGACRAALILRGRYAEERVNAIAARAAEEEKG